MTSEKEKGISFSFLLFLMLKVSRGEQPQEKDLDIGYEDQVFFHLNKNDYKIL